MGRRKTMDFFEIKNELQGRFGNDLITTKEAQQFLGYKSYPSFYTYILKPMVERGLIEKPFRGVIKVAEYLKNEN